MKVLSLTIALLLGNLILAQELSSIGSLRLPITPDDLEIDNFRNIYLVSDTELRKLDAEGNFQASFAAPNFGRIDQVDLLNALNPLIYYADFNQIRILDNRLNESRSFSMLSLGFNDPKYVAYSDQNRFWVYDQSADRLMQYSLSDNRISNRSPIISQIRGKNSLVTGLFSSFNYNMVYLENEGFLIFDAVGAMDKFISCTDQLRSIDLYNDRILCLNSKGLLSIYSLPENRSPQTFISPAPKAQKALLGKDKVFIWEADRLHIYRLD